MNLFPKPTRPYYICSPSYTHKSSGVRTLHLLCHALNEMGQKAQLVNLGAESPYYVNPNLNTPVATNGEFYDPIVVYPDIVFGNPLGKKNIVRYLLAPAGAYGGSKTFPETDLVYGALPSIAPKVLRLPVSDPNIFNDLGDEPDIEAFKKGLILAKPLKRSGSCFYSHKYEMHGNLTDELSSKSRRLEGSLKEIADILRKSEMCYLYEVSSILTEAALCGCPVTLVRTPYLKTIDPACMMGNVKWSDGKIVKETNDFTTEYQKIIDDFWPQLAQFIKETQAMV